jgi:hypothetical protein
MTDPYKNAAHKRVIDSWRKGKNFAVWERDNFQYYDTEKQVLKSTLKPFTQAPKPTVTPYPPR